MKAQRNKKQSSLIVRTSPHSVGRDRWVRSLISVGDLVVLCVDSERVEVYKEGQLLWQSKYPFSGYAFAKGNKFEYEFSRVCKISSTMLYFGQRATMEKRGKIVRVNLDTFEEVVLDKLADNIADFLVDENQTITYLTSQGELRQENPDNSSIPKTCVNLKDMLPSAKRFQSLCKISADLFVSTSYLGSKNGNLLLLSTAQNLLKSETIPLPPITGYYMGLLCGKCKSRLDSSVLVRRGSDAQLQQEKRCICCVPDLQALPPMCGYPTKSSNDHS